MRFGLILALCLACIFITGCCSAMVRNYKLFTFDDFGNKIQNEQQCLQLCKDRESNGVYHCDYEPVYCENGRCMCKTF
jgi:hypothetical protein